MKLPNKIGVVTDSKSWFLPYSKELVERIETEFNIATHFYEDHRRVPNDADIVFLLSYFSVVDEAFINCFEEVLIVHESDLPKGRGWAPLFWQIIEGKNIIPVVLFKAIQNVDAGPILIKNYIELDGNELHDEIRKKQAEVTISMCLQFLEDYNKITPKKQKGKPSVFPKRTPEDSELDIDKTIRSQFNLLRTLSNEEYPAFFKISGQKYILKIYKESDFHG